MTNKITLEITKQLNPQLFDKLNSENDKIKYLDYLVNLERELVGTDQEYNTYTIGETYIKELKSNTCAIKKDLIKQIELLIKSLYHLIPKERLLGFMGPEGDIINIPDDSLLMKLYLCCQKLEVLKGVEDENNIEEFIIKWMMEKESFTNIEIQRAFHIGFNRTELLLKKLLKEGKILQKSNNRYCMNVK